MTNKLKKIAPPSVTKDATEKLLRKMYISNVAKRLRELNAPSDVDRKRWVWELIQNAKDTIVGDSTRNDINIRIEIEGDIVRFRHDGNPFTADARFGLLYKYSEDKENQESTGRFGTGFLTTHCLSKVVTIESNMYTNQERTTLCGFSVTMYRDGQIEKELLDGLDKMQESEAYYENTFDWTTFTYHVSTDSGRRAIELGIDNFHENIAQTMLFCKELASVQLNENGKITSIVRKPIVEVAPGVMSAEFDIKSGDETLTRRFIYTSFSKYSKDLSERYRATRNIRINAAIEVDSSNCIVNHSGKTSHFCVLPLVGIETQLDEPLILNSPDFEPDSERQSLLLTGQSWNEENNNITETGINQAIYKNVFGLYDKLVAYLTHNHYGKLYLLANGLKKAKEHDKLDGKWYMDNVIKNFREVLLKYPIVEPYSGEEYKLLSDCIFVKETKTENEEALCKLLSNLYPNKLVKVNHAWSQYVWKDGLKAWSTDDLCNDIEEKKNWNSISLDGVSLLSWYNEFLTHVYKYDERYLKEHALLPNMNGDFMKKDAENFKQGERVSNFIIDLLMKLGKDMKPYLLHNDITAISLDSKYNSQSYSADCNKLAKTIIDNNSTSPSHKLQTLLPLLSVLPTDREKYNADFIEKRNDFFNIAKSLYSLTEATSYEDNNLLEGAWKELDIWFVTYVLNCLDNLGEVSKLPNSLDAIWLNHALESLKVETSKLNVYKVLPNQNGKFCIQKDLFEDNGIPEVLKDSVFNEISLIYKDILLHKDICASSFAINQKKDIPSFASELKSKFTSQISTNSIYPYSINGRYFKFSQTTLNKVSLYMLSLLPSDKNCETGKSQYALYRTAANLLDEDIVPQADVISYSEKDLWQDSNFFVASAIADKVKSLGRIEKLNELLGAKGETYIFEQLNAFYDFLNSSGISYTAPRIFPNQEGIFCAWTDLKKEEGSIEDIIKNIINKLVDDEQDYRHILMDTRCHLQPQAILNADRAYALIDEKISEYYKNPEKWKDDNFIEATQLLIEDWGDKHKGTFEEKFPRVFDDKEKILMNVVWKKEKRELMLTLNNRLTEDQLKFVIENSADIGELTDKVKHLEDENDVLKSQLAAMGLMNELSIENENADDYNIDNLSDVIVPTEIESVTETGESRTITVAEPQYAGLSADEMKDYLVQAKTDVKLYLEEKGYCFTRGICVSIR